MWNHKPHDKSLCFATLGSWKWTCAEFRNGFSNQTYVYEIQTEGEIRRKSGTNAQRSYLHPHRIGIEMPIEHDLKWKRVTFSVTYIHFFSTTVKMKVLSDVYTRPLSNQRQPLFCLMFMASVTSEQWWVKGNEPCAVCRVRWITEAYKEHITTHIWSLNSLQVLLHSGPVCYSAQTNIKENGSLDKLIVCVQQQRKPQTLLTWDVHFTAALICLFAHIHFPLLRPADASQRWPISQGLVWRVSLRCLDREITACACDAGVCDRERLDCVCLSVSHVKVCAGEHERTSLTPSRYSCHCGES